MRANDSMVGLLGLQGDDSAESDFQLGAAPVWAVVHEDQAASVTTPVAVSAAALAAATTDSRDAGFTMPERAQDLFKLSGLETTPFRTGHGPYQIDPVAQPAISVSDVTVGESDGFAEFVVTLNAPGLATVTVSYDTQNGTASDSGSSDYTRTTGVLTFLAGETTKTIQVPITNDAVAEQTQNFFMQIYSPSANATVAKQWGLGTIIDNDGLSGNPVASVSDMVIDEQSGQAMFVVTLDRPSTGAVGMNYTTQSGTALAGSDFVSTAGTLSFAAGEVSKTIAVTINNDTVAELSEAFNLAFSGFTGGVSMLDPIGTAVIYENDGAVVAQPSVLVDDVTVGEGSTYVDFVVRLSAPAQGVVTVKYQTVDGTASYYYNGTDYQARSTDTLTFAQGETVKVVRVLLTDDAVPEGAENFFLQLHTPSANATIGRPFAYATIIDNDGLTGNPVVSVGDFVVDEQTREASFVVTLDRPSAGTVSMNYATQDGTALAGSDYVAASGTLNFAAGEVTKTVKVTVTNDSVAELSEAFNLVLSGFGGGVSALDATGTAVIHENDGAPVAQPSISVDDLTVGEGQTYADFLVRLSAPAQGPITVNYATADGTASYYYNGTDYQNSASQLTFAQGETVKTVRVLLTDGTTPEALENFFLTLNTPSANATIGKAKGIATVIDNDGLTGNPVVSISDMVVDEQSREASFVVTLDRPSAGTVSMNYATQNGTALAGSDYVAASGALSFAAGEVTKTVKVTITNDSVAELSEAFNLVLSGFAGGVTALDAVGTAVIHENDAAPVFQPSVTVDDVTVGEGQGYVDFLVKLNAPATSALTVEYDTADGTASYYYNGTDYQASSGKLTFAQGETVKTVRVLLTDGATAEQLENFFLTLNTPSSNVTIGRAKGTATIIDNDGLTGNPVVSIGDMVVDEQGREASFVVTLDRPSAGTVAMNYATQNGTALAGSDYVAASGALTFAAGEVTKTIKVTITNDSVAELSESFNLVLSGFTGGVTALDATGTAVIHENDAAPIFQPSITMDDATVGEGQGYVDFLVKLSAPATSALTVNYATTDGTGSYYYNGTDYQSFSGTLTFAQGETVKTVRVLLTNDTTAEQAENFFLVLTTPSSNAAIADGVAMATVIDNDGLTGNPVASVGDLVVDEQSREASFVITLDRASTGAVSMNYATQNGTALAGSDYVAATGTVSFAAGEVSKTVKVTITNDSVAELSEAFNLVLSGFTGGVTALDAVATAVINENDAAPTSQTVISVDDVTIGEGQGYAEFLIKLSAPSTGPVTLQYYTNDGTATGSGSADYLDYNTQNLTFAQGETVKTVRVLITDNATPEGAENLFLILINPSANAVIGRSYAIGTIIDNDAVTGNPVASVTDVVIDEQAREATFVVTLDRPSVGAVTMNYATQNAGAVAGSDYVAASGTLTFAAGQVAQTVKVTITNDAVSELDEAFNLVLSGFTGGVTAENPLGTAVIHQNDAAPVSQPVISASDIVVAEGQGYASFVVNLSAPSANPVSVRYYTASNTATASADYQNISTNTLLFSPGEMTKTVRIQLTDDFTPESAETFFLKLNTPVGGTLATTSATATIIDDDNGAKVLAYGLGDDTYQITHTSDYIVESVNAGNDTAQTTVTYTLTPNVENLTMLGTGGISGTGNELANRLIGNSGTNVLNGGGGDDYIDGGDGNDAMYGGTGNDTYIVSQAGDTANETSVVIGEIDTVQASLSWTLSTNIENLNLVGTGPLNGTGNASDNRISGNAGANTLSGLGGADTLIGNDGADYLDGGAGNDTMIGGLGNDTYVVDSVSDIVVESTVSPTEIDTVRSSVNWLAGANIENLVLTGGSPIKGTGNALANTITGNNLANTIDGGAGNDTMIGGLGNDYYFVDSTGDVVVETSALPTEIDTVESKVSWTAGANIENVTLSGSAALDATGNSLANRLTGNAGANTLTGGAGNDTIVGNDGADILIGGTGGDLMVGGLGNDTYYVDSTSDTVSEGNASPSEIDTVYASISWNINGNVERLYLQGGNINAGGNSLANTLVGTDGNNTLNGGAGNDTMTGGLGNDLYVVDSAGDVLIETSALPTEIDNVQSTVNWTLATNFENLTFTGSAALVGTGNAVANRLGGNDGANLLDGKEGNDVLVGGAGADTLIGGLGSDTLIGDTGNDTYVVDVNTDVVVESSVSATEIDTVQSRATWTLGANLENLSLTGTGAINGTGNSLNNLIIGNSASNVLRGNDGADTIDGGLGNDNLGGGAGQDTFRFASALNGSTNVDIVSDFNSVDDTLLLDDAVFTAIGPVGALNAAAFVIGSAAVDASDRIVYDQALGKLYYDADGSGAGAKLLFATFTAGTVVTAGDIWVG